MLVPAAKLAKAARRILVWESFARMVSGRYSDIASCDLTIY